MKGKDPDERRSLWVSRKSTLFGRLALELTSELLLAEREGSSPQAIMEVQLDWLIASMKVVRQEAAEGVLALSTLKLMRSPLQQRLASLQTELNYTLRSVHALPVLSLSSTPEYVESSTETSTPETTQDSSS